MTDNQTVIDEQLWKKIVSPDEFSGEVRFREPMRSHTYLRIGGHADILAYPNDTRSLSSVLSILTVHKIPFMILGGGTNILVSDNGIEGAVISLKNFRRIELVEGEKNLVSVYAEAGAQLQRLVNYTKENSYSGIEGLAGIPGSVGGAIAGNAGAFDYSMKDAVISARIMKPNGRIVEKNVGELGLGYRKSGIDQDMVILSCNLRLRIDSKEKIAGRIDSYLVEKSSKQPISDFSAGCVFKNPSNMFAGKLIDEAGCMGMRIGDIEVSHKHANFFININEGTAEDFIKLIDKVRNKVMSVFNVELEPEIKIIGRA